MRNVIRRILMLGLMTVQTASGLMHQGGMHTAEDLQRIRSKAAAGKEPGKSAWAALELSGPDARYKADVDAVIVDGYPTQVQGHAAYLLALKWVASGNKAYAAACNIQQDWPNISTLQRGMWYPVWEAAERIFTNAGVPHPNTTRVVKSSGFVDNPIVRLRKGRLIFATGNDPAGLTDHFHGMDGRMVAP